MPDSPTAASLPATALGAIADLRRAPGLLVLVKEDRAWLRWDGTDPSLAHRLMSVPGAVLYARGDDELWREPGRRLPSFGLPLDGPGFTTLVHAIVPEPIDPVTPPKSCHESTVLRLERDDRERPATAMVCELAQLSTWADSALSAEFASVSAAVCGGQVILRGRPANLPVIVGSKRFWGLRLLVPLGWRIEPALPERAILRAVCADDDDLLLVIPPGLVEPVPLDAFAPLTRASLRLAIAAGGTRP